jgi:hypothetical protein
VAGAGQQVKDGVGHIFRCDALRFLNAGFDSDVLDDAPELIENNTWGDFADPHARPDEAGGTPHKWRPEPRAWRRSRQVPSESTGAQIPSWS